MYNKIVGGTVLIVGDLHFSDVYKGKHKDYLLNCCGILAEIVAKVKAEKPSAVVFLGDLVGWVETNIKNRQVLAMFLKAFQEMRNVCPVYAVCGNHDMNGFPEFNLLAQLGLIITSSACSGYFDYYGTESSATPEVRFHLVDYGKEHGVLNLAEGSVSNVVLGHNNYTIQGVTNWYNDFDGIELGRLSNFDGVDMVISGHIHNPSPEFVSTQMPDDGICSLFYAGCPTRPVKEKNMYDSVWWIKFTYNGVDTDVTTEAWNLAPASEVFLDDNAFVEERDESVKEADRRKELREVLDDILQYRMLGGDPIEQVKNIPNATDDAKNMAINYLQMALNRQV